MTTNDHSSIISVHVYIYHVALSWKKICINAANDLQKIYKFQGGSQYYELHLARLTLYSYNVSYHTNIRNY